MTIKTLGVDLGKTGCHIVGQDASGHQVVVKRLSNKKFAGYLAQLPPCRVLFEACGGAHYWARKAEKFGHEAALIPAQFVKPYVKSNKNDWIDAEAICEAGQRPTMRYANIRSEEQQSLGALLKLRDGLVTERTACVNRAHAFLLEFGIPVNRGRGFVRKVAALVADDQSPLPLLMRDVLKEVLEQHARLSGQIERIEKQLTHFAQKSESGKLLMTIPGVGVMTACYIMAWVGSGAQFKSGREFAAWIGLVPRQHSTGGVTRMLGISKRGNGGLRKFLIHGARSAIQWKMKEDHTWTSWVGELLKRKPKTVAVVAMANKLARIVWAVLTSGNAYSPKYA